MGKGIYKHERGEQASHYKHGLRNTRLYRIWSNMKNRCTNSKSNRASRYLDRGITVCDEWKNDFTAFCNWAITHGYADNLTIDRIDNNGNYEPSNCRWATVVEQNLNKESTPKYEYQGIIFHQCEVYHLFGVKPTTFRARLKRGLSVTQAIEKE